MPDKFEQLKMRWDEVCKDEVVPQYRAEERQALEVSPVSTLEQFFRNPRRDEAVRPTRFYVSAQITVYIGVILALPC